MTRNIFVVSVLCFVMAFGLVACNKEEGPRVAVVDAEKIYQNSKLAQGGMKYIEEVSKKFQARVEEMQKDVQADPENQELVMKLQAELMSLQGDFEARQVEAGNKLNKLFEDVIEEYRVQNNLEVILPLQVVIAKRLDADVTEAIIELLDSKTLDYGGVDAPAAENAPAPAPESTPEAAQSN